MNPGKKTAAEGFSLIEVLVAVTILAMGLGGLYQALGLGLRAADSGVGHSRAVMHAQSILEAAGVESRLEVGVESGALNGGYEWERRVDRYVDPDGLDAYAPLKDSFEPFLVTVTVSWAGGRGPRQIALNSVQFR